ncbi:hypothetical protein CEXT_441371 [Caerostris extrusa]|uniref:Uncharacterized protein n=1 Tax=Caerostris extrusa TaxID=172846 RepID=A0AAV4UM87_CAEEX|nr:hypothetical protein CEXT_441371 [Caerostris extrusa]
MSQLYDEELRVKARPSPSLSVACDPKSMANNFSIYISTRSKGARISRPTQTWSNKAMSQLGECSIPIPRGVYTNIRECPDSISSSQWRTYWIQHI